MKSVDSKQMKNSMFIPSCRSVAVQYLSGWLKAKDVEMFQISRFKNNMYQLCSLLASSVQNILLSQSKNYKTSIDNIQTLEAWDDVFRATVQLYIWAGLSVTDFGECLRAFCRLLSLAERFLLIVTPNSLGPKAVAVPLHVSTTFRWPFE